MAGLPPVEASIIKQRVRCKMQPVIANRSSERCGNPFFTEEMTDSHASVPTGSE